MTSPGCMGTTRNPSFSLQWKSEESTKHYLIQLLLAINWQLLGGGKKFTHAYECSRSPHANALHFNPPGFRKKKVGYFPNYSIKFHWLLILYVCLFRFYWSFLLSSSFVVFSSWYLISSLYWISSYSTKYCCGLPVKRYFLLYVFHTTERKH